MHALHTYIASQKRSPVFFIVICASIVRFYQFLGDSLYVYATFVCCQRHLTMQPAHLLFFRWCVSSAMPVRLYYAVTKVQ